MSDSLGNYSSRALYNTGRRVLQDLTGFNIELKAGYEYMHNLKITKLVKPEAPKGLTYPEDFMFRRLISRTDLEDLMDKFDQFSDRIADDEIINFWRPLIKPKSASTSNPITAYGGQLLSTDSEISKRYNTGAPNKKISIHPDNLPEGVYPESFLPERSWFKPEMQEIEIKDILTILPEAEQEILSICLGRAVVGCSGTKHLESDEPISHTFRTFPLIFGRDPGQGKSILFQRFLIPALMSVGYRVNIFNTLSEKFGMAHIAEADFAYKDDLTTKEILENLSGRNTKTLISGGPISVEEKFIKSYRAYAGCALFCNINLFDMKKVSELDEGILERLAVLQTKSNIELKYWKPEGASAGSKDPFPDSHLEFLKDKYDIDLETLALWLFRLCADKFMDILAQNRPKEGYNALHVTIRNWTKELAVQLTYSLALKNVCALFQFAYKLRDKDEKFIENLGKNVLHTALIDGTYLSVAKKLKPIRDEMRQHWLDHHKPDSHPYTALQALRLGSLDSALRSVSEIVKKDKAPLKDVLKALFASLSINNGFSLSYSENKVASAWYDARKLIQSDEIKELVRRVEEIYTDDIVEALTQEHVINDINTDIAEML